MYSILLIVIVILAVLLCFIVTIQNSKGGGLAAGFSSSNQIMGVRKTTDLLEKTTWYLISGIVVLSIFTSYVNRSTPSTSDPVMMRPATEQILINPETSPSYEVPISDIPIE
ncbi:MAG TPA: preprotein translocase subunit SecG [Bacteroidaceae bacterium]|nr:preprotein translocase subunit SecG [Bacteroidaceae bacterium]